MLLKNPKVYNPPRELEKKKFPKFFLIIFILIIIFGGLIYFLFYSSLFRIKNIIIEDSNSQVSNFCEKYKGSNILLFSSSRIEEEIIEKFPEVKDLEVIRGLPDTIKIRFQDRQSKIIWQTQGKNFLVDNSGQIYKETEDLSDLPQVKDNKDISVNIGQQVVSESFLNFLTELNSTFTQANGFKINRFEINDTIFQVDALTDQGWTVIFDTTRKVTDQLSDLSKFLNEHKNEVIEYIDLRVEGRVYYK